MAGVPIRARYGPTLGELLAPGWRRMRPRTHRLIALAAGVVLVAAVAAYLTLEDASYSHSGRVSFGFSYRGLYRVAPGEGTYVRLERRAPDGHVDDSFAVSPLELPPYRGLLSGELPLFADGFVKSLAASYPAFQLRGEGKSKLDVNTAYDIYFTTREEGRTEFGRIVLYMPERAGTREGVAISMLTRQAPRNPLTAPPEVAATGILERPLRSFAFG